MRSGAHRWLHDPTFNKLVMWMMKFTSFTLVSLILFTVSHFGGSLELKPEIKAYNDFIGLIPNGLLDSRMKESLKDIAKFADKIFSRVDKAPAHPLPVNLGLLRLYALHTKLAAIPDAQNGHYSSAVSQVMQEKEANLSEDFIAEALHYFAYADESYKPNPRIVQQDILLNNLPDKESSNIKLPRHIVFLDHIAKSIVIAVRGTASFSDMLTDLYIEPYPFLEPSRNLYAHHGMAESAEALLPLVTSAINEIRHRDDEDENDLVSGIEKPWWKKIVPQKKKNKYHKYKVVVTGHSLGAGTASLLAILLCMKSNISATAYAYAPPPVISAIDPLPHLHSSPRTMRLPFSKQKQPHYRIHAFVHNNDIISRSSHTQILSLVSALSAVDQVKWGALDRGAILLRNVLSAEEAQVIHEALKHRKHFIEGNDRDLYIPGDIYIMRPVPFCAESNVTLDRGIVSVGAPSEHASILAANATISSTPSSSNTTSDATAVALNASNSSSGEDGNSTQLTNATKQEVSFNLFGVTIPPPPTPAQIGAAAGLIVTEVQTFASHGANHTISAVGNFTKDRGVLLDPNAAAPDKNASVIGEYYCVKRAPDARALFNGLMYYGDAMVYDHLTVPFEKAILLLKST